VKFGPTDIQSYYNFTHLLVFYSTHTPVTPLVSMCNVLATNSLRASSQRDFWRGILCDICLGIFIYKIPLKRLLQASYVLAGSALRFGTKRVSHALAASAVWGDWIYLVSEIKFLVNAGPEDRPSLRKMLLDLKNKLRGAFHTRLFWLR
jgi:hypothetical protein